MPTSIMFPDWSGPTNIAKPVSSSERPPAREFSTACRMSSSEIPCLRALARISTPTRLVVNSGSRKSHRGISTFGAPVDTFEPFGSSSANTAGLPRPREVDENIERPPTAASATPGRAVCRNSDGCHGVWPPSLSIGLEASSVLICDVQRHGQSQDSTVAATDTAV